MHSPATVTNLDLGPLYSSPYIPALPPSLCSRRVSFSFSTLPHAAYSTPLCGLFHISKRLTLRATCRGTPHGTSFALRSSQSCLVGKKPDVVFSSGTRGSIYGHTATASHDMITPSAPSPPSMRPPLDFFTPHLSIHFSNLRASSAILPLLLLFPTFTPLAPVAELDDANAFESDADLTKPAPLPLPTPTSGSADSSLPLLTRALPPNLLARSPTEESSSCPRRNPAPAPFSETPPAPPVKSAPSRSSSSCRCWFSFGTGLEVGDAAGPTVQRLGCVCSEWSPPSSSSPLSSPRP